MNRPASPVRSVLFIQPPLEVNARHKRVMPLGIAYLMAVLRRDLPGLNLQFLDLQSGNLTVADALPRIAAAAPDLLCLSYWTPMADAAEELARRARPLLPAGSRVIAGGVHPSIFPAAALAFADFVVVGEAEATLPELIRDLNRGGDPAGIRGLWYRAADGKPAFTGERELLPDLDALPFPAWDLMPLANYDTPLHLIGGRRMPVIGSRGCPYNCSYCVSPVFWRRRLRWRSPDNIVDEIIAIRRQYGLTSIHFWDDNLLLDRGQVTRLCELLIARAPDTRWIGLTRAAHVRACGDLLPLLKRAGCLGLEMGIESADPQASAAVHKDDDLADTRIAAELLKRAGLVPLFTYMALNPGDTLQTYYRQAEFIDAMLAGCDPIAHFHHMPVPLYVGQLCTPHPGTQLHADASRLGLVNTRTWRDYYHHRVNFLPRTLLDERPQQQTPELTYRDLLICVKAQIATQYGFTPPGSSPLLRVTRTAELLAFLHAFYRRCDGNRSLQAIAHEVQAELRLTDDGLWNYTGVQTVVLAQLGRLQPVGRTALPQRDINLDGFGDTMLQARLIHAIDLLKPLLRRLAPRT